MKRILFNKSRELETEISEYLDTVDKSALLFERNVFRYLNKNFEDFEESLEDVLEVERDADDYQKDIKYKLYKYMLIPESRGDVLALLESVDNVVDLSKEVLTSLSIERPEIPEFLEQDYKDLTEQTVRAISELVKALRAYFEEINMVNDYVNKVQFHEHEADKCEEKLKRKVFKSDYFTEFSKKVHMRYFAERIALLSDESEQISERLSVAAIKRSI